MKIRFYQKWLLQNAVLLELAIMKIMFSAIFILLLVPRSGMDV
ncbi:hypothetical protein [Neomoorella thermoacetica]|nr:hypothetical protein [Moorella thermoacetica]